MPSTSQTYLGGETSEDSFEDSPPHSMAFEATPISDRHVTARPHSPARPALSGDDYDAISADDLGSAFLARVTDANSDDNEPSSLDGFRIVKID